MADAAPGLACRREAVRLLSRVLRHHEPFDSAFETSVSSGALSALEPRDRSLTHAIVSTSLRRLGEIEGRLRALIPKPLPRKSGLAREILATAAAQVLFLRTPPHASIDLAVRLASAAREARHLSGLVNAVLRRLANEPPEQVDGSLNVPPWLWRRWRENHGLAAAQAIVASHLEEPPLDLSVRGEPDAWAERLGGVLLPTGTVRLAQASGAVDALAGFSDGAWWVQDAAAALPAKLLGDVAGRRVLDLCAAPGGKTAQLAAAGAEVTAVDRSPQRLKRLEENLRRLGLPVNAIEADLRDFAAPGRFDAVLLDAPCSATGTIRRHPDIPYLKQESDIPTLAQLQRRLLERAAAFVEPGGLLVYSTCSLEPEEGENQATLFLENHPHFERQPIRPQEVGNLGHLIAPSGDLRTLPFHGIGESRGLDGFYAARFIRH